MHGKTTVKTEQGVEKDISALLGKTVRKLKKLKEKAASRFSLLTNCYSKIK
jgi:hypothetical protein